MDQQEKEQAGASTMPAGVSAAALAKVPLALVLTNPHLDGNPIVYANRAFETITRYSIEAAIGRNCKFLQGDETDPEHVRQISEALRERRDVSVDIVNYRADGTKFLNRLMITPLYDDDGKLQCFLGVQRDMSDGADLTHPANDDAAGELDAALGEIQHRVKNHLAMIIGMIRMQARTKTSEESFHALARRIESLQLLYQEMTEAGVGSARSKRLPLGAYVSRIASTIGHLDGRRSVRVNVDCDAVEVSVERAARVGLLFSELLTNALKHAFAGRDEGLVEARLKMLSSGVIRMTVTDDGVGLPEGSDWPYGGARAPAPIDEETAATVRQAAAEAVADAEPNAAREIAEAIGMGRSAESGDGSAVVETGEQADRRRRAREAQRGLGGRIAVSLVRGLGARLDVNTNTSGTTVTVDIPPDPED
ncbi:MAG: PAS domain-containing protein [Aurantimonas endophytica]|uniref:PAS domain S-box-containing protein n=1 Tax=Aurantimonas endophytica TaxID=1522175 RepID=A0A7W6HHE5_9HYPH|nr:PAS domain-containing protein [Aurantimonas endophytica]MBB4005228.1 PAS domain S-box-containing protein [Aurantimonas endophytica]MCO6406109.1 PAS domain-containing protein [Aurantimonas endophytica]